MYPRLFELGPITVYTYGVLLAAAYLLGLKFAMVRAKARGLDAVRVLTSASTHHQRAVGAKLLLLITDSVRSRRPAGTAHAGALRRRVLRRPDSRRHRRLCASAAPACRCDDLRRLRRGSPSATSSDGSDLLRRLLLWQADDAAPGDHLHGSVCGRQCRHSARRASTPPSCMRPVPKG